MNRRSIIARWCVVVGYALAMAWVEAAVVFYLRTLVHRIEPYQRDPLPIAGGLGGAELVREAATLIMLLAVGTLAGRTWRARLGFAAIAFGFWDIFYYVFLRVLCGWPRSVWDWDILFLIPLPWWGPVLAPVLIALLMIGWGTVSVFDRSSASGFRRELGAWVLNFVGIVLALQVFMAETLKVASRGADAVRAVLPLNFHWSQFLLALLLMSAPLLWGLRRLLRPLSERTGATPIMSSLEVNVTTQTPPLGSTHQNPS